MHYARNTYSINVFLDTIQPIGIPQGKKVPEIGQRIGLSAGDIQQTQILYNCPSKFPFIKIVSIVTNYGSSRMWQDVSNEIRTVCVARFQPQLGRRIRLVRVAHQRHARRENHPQHHLHGYFQVPQLFQRLPGGARRLLEEIETFRYATVIQNNDFVS